MAYANGDLKLDLTIDGDTQKVSDRWLSGESNEQYRGYIRRIDPIEWLMDTAHGGLVRYKYGQIGLDPRVFTLDSPNNWPPPIKLTGTLDIVGDGAASQKITLHRASISPVEAAYSVYQQERDELLLATGTDHNGDTVPLPRAFGPVTHERPQQVQGSDSGDLLDNENGDFESLSGGPFTFTKWTDSVAGGSQVLANTTVEHEGTYCCELECGNLGGAYARTYNDELDTSYELASLPMEVSFWTRGDGTAEGRFEIAESDGASYSDIVSMQGTGITETTWTQIIVRFTCASDTEQLRIRFECNNLNNSAFFDDVQARHLEPLKTFHNGYMSGNLAEQINTVSDNGSGYIRIKTDTNHGYGDGETVYIEGLDAAVDDIVDGYAIDLVDADEFDLPVPWIAGLSAAGITFQDGDWRVYGDGLPLDVTDNGDNTFTLKTPSDNDKDITISGTGTDTDLDDITDWCVAADQLNISSDTTGARSPIPSLAHWQTEQIQIMDFLSNICATFYHVLYDVGDTLYLQDMKANNGTRSLSDGDFFTPTLFDNPPKKLIKATWETRKHAVEDSQDVIVTEQHEATQATDYDAYAEDELHIPPYHNDRTTIEAVLAAIDTIIEKPRAEIPLLIHATRPVPGEAISLTTTKFHISTDVTIRARGVIMDRSKGNRRLIVRGEGTVTETS